MEHQEIEVKFYLTDLLEIRNRIEKLGATSRGRVFETNIRYEDKTSGLIKTGRLLRLRKDGRTTLTFKSKPETGQLEAQDRQFKVHRELEVEVDDFDTMSAILNELGFHREQVYEKWRETFEIDETIFCLDSLPFGDFLEIEGGRDDITTYAARLGLRWDDRILENYLGLFELLRRQYRLSFNDVTFDNFSNLQIDCAGPIRSTTIGRKQQRE